MLDALIFIAAFTFFAAIYYRSKNLKQHDVIIKLQNRLNEELLKKKYSVEYYSSYTHEINTPNNLESKDTETNVLKDKIKQAIELEQYELAQALKIKLEKLEN
jgi:hypothetical protein